MDYSPSLSHSFSFDSSSPPLTKNQRRLQLRQTLSSRTLPKASAYTDEPKSIIVQKTRQRSSSGSSKSSSTRSNPTSPFRNNFEGFGLYAQYTGDNSKPSSPEDRMEDSLHLKFGTPPSMRRRKSARQGSVYSEASTLVEGGFGDLVALGNQTLLGPRFCDSASGSGSGSGSDHSYEKSARESSTGGSLKKSARRKNTGRKVSGGSSDGYQTPPRRGSNMKNSSHHSYSDMHPEDAAKYIEHLEAQNQDLTTQLHNLTSPTSATPIAT